MKAITIRRGLDLRRHIEEHGPIKGARELANVCGMRKERASQWVRNQGHRFGVVVTSGKVGRSRVNVYRLDPSFDPATIPPVGKTNADRAVMAIPGILASGNMTVTELSQSSGLANSSVQTALYRLRDAGVVSREREQYGPNGSYRYRYRLTADAVAGCSVSGGAKPMPPSCEGVVDNDDIDGQLLKIEAWFEAHGGVDAATIARAYGWPRRTVADRLQRLAPEYGWTRVRASTGKAAIAVYVNAGDGAQDAAQKYAELYAEGGLPAATQQPEGGSGRVSGVGQAAWVRSWTTRVASVAMSGDAYDVVFDASHCVDTISADPALAAALLANGAKITITVEPNDVG